MTTKCRIYKLYGSWMLAYPLVGNYGVLTAHDSWSEALTYLCTPTADMVCNAIRSQRLYGDLA